VFFRSFYCLILERDTETRSGMDGGLFVWRKMIPGRIALYFLFLCLSLRRIGRLCAIINKVLFAGRESRLSVDFVDQYTHFGFQKDSPCYENILNNLSINT